MGRSVRIEVCDCGELCISLDVPPALSRCRPLFIHRTPDTGREAVNYALDDDWAPIKRSHGGAGPAASWSARSRSGSLAVNDSQEPFLIQLSERAIATGTRWPAGSSGAIGDKRGRVASLSDIPPPYPLSTPRMFLRFPMVLSNTTPPIL
ncbi:unnamed protein product, partial [Iphiclides podalirius]